MACQSSDPLCDQPILTIECDGLHYTLLGTAHVSRASVDAVRHLIFTQAFDAVAVELCETRFHALRNPGALANLDLFRVIRDGKMGFVAANLALSAYQRRLAEQLGIEPGAEMRAAIDTAEARGVMLWRIDRDIGITLRRAYAAVGFWQKFRLSGGLFASLFVDEQVDPAEIERLKQGDILESTFHEFAQRSDALYRTLIVERDRYMAATLREQAQRMHPTPKRVLVVIGAGHLQGLRRLLAEELDAPCQIRAELDQLPRNGRWGRWLAWLLTAFVLGGFIYGFNHSTEMGGDLVLRWILSTGLLGALGCLVAGGHPLSVIGAFVASPLTPLHPALASGTVSALIEAWMRRPTVADFARLRDDASRPSGWWRNRVTRVLLNFFLTSAGTAIGVYLAGWSMLERLL